MHVITGSETYKLTRIENSPPPALNQAHPSSVETTHEWLRQPPPGSNQGASSSQNLAIMNIFKRLERSGTPQHQLAQATLHESSTAQLNVTEAEIQAALEAYSPGLNSVFSARTAGQSSAQDQMVPPDEASGITGVTSREALDHEITPMQSNRVGTSTQNSTSLFVQNVVQDIRATTSTGTLASLFGDVQEAVRNSVSPVIRSAQTIGSAIKHLITDEIPKDFKNAGQYHADFAILEKLSGTLSGGDPENGEIVTLETTVDRLRTAKDRLNTLTNRNRTLKNKLSKHIDTTIDQLQKLKANRNRTPQRIAGALMAATLIPVVSIYAFDQGKKLIGKEPSFRGPTIMNMVAKAPLSAARLWSASNSPAARMDSLWNTFRDRHAFDLVKAAVFGTLNLTNNEPQPFDKETGEGSDAAVIGLATSMGAALFGLLTYTQMKDAAGHVINAVFRGSQEPDVKQAAQNLSDSGANLSEEDRLSVQEERQALQDVGGILRDVNDLMGSLYDKAGISEDEASGASKVLRGRIGTIKTNTTNALQTIETVLGQPVGERPANQDVSAKIAYMATGLSILVTNAAVQLNSDLTNAPGEFANAAVTAGIMGLDVKNPDLDQRGMSETLANWVGYQSLTMILNAINGGQESAEKGSGFLRDAGVAAGSGLAVGLFGSTVTRIGAELLDKIVSAVRAQMPEIDAHAALEAFATMSRQQPVTMPVVLTQQITDFGNAVSQQFIHRAAHQ